MKLRSSLPGSLLPVFSLSLLLAAGCSDDSPATDSGTPSDVGIPVDSGAPDSGAIDSGVEAGERTELLRDQQGAEELAKALSFLLRNLQQN